MAKNVTIKESRRHLCGFGSMSPERAAEIRKMASMSPRKGGRGYAPPGGETKSRQINFMAPPSLHARLKGAADLAGRSVGAEIVARLEQSLA